MVLEGEKPKPSHTDSESRSVSRSVLVTLWDPIDCSPLGSSVHWNLQARICSELPFPSPGDFPNPGMESGSPALQPDSLPSEPAGKLSLMVVPPIILLQIFLVCLANYSIRFPYILTYVFFAMQNNLASILQMSLFYRPSKFILQRLANTLVPQHWHSLNNCFS